MAEILTALQGATPMMALVLALGLAIFVVWSGLKIINLLGNHLIHAIGDLKAELITLNKHETVEQAELIKQTASLQSLLKVTVDPPAGP